MEDFVPLTIQDLEAIDIKDNYIGNDAFEEEVQKEMRQLLNKTSEEEIKNPGN